jgi:hypothetical protein
VTQETKGGITCDPNSMNENDSHRDHSAGLWSSRLAQRLFGRALIYSGLKNQDHDLTKLGWANTRAARKARAANDRALSAAGTVEPTAETGRPQAEAPPPLPMPEEEAPSAPASPGGRFYAEPDNEPPYGFRVFRPDNEPLPDVYNTLSEAQTAARSQNIIATPPSPLPRDVETERAADVAAKEMAPPATAPPPSEPEVERLALDKGGADVTTAPNPTHSALGSESFMRPSGGTWVGIGVLVAIAGSVIVATVGPALIDLWRDSQENRYETERAAENALMSDRVKALRELERRLSERIELREGIVVIADPVSEIVYALPSSAPWIVDCDIFGLNITFAIMGTAETYREIKIELTSARLRKEECQDFAPAVGHMMMTISSVPTRPAGPAVSGRR